VCGGTPVYKWWTATVSGTGAVTWTQATAYTTSGTFTWTPQAPGNYQIAAWIQNQGSPDGAQDVVPYTWMTVATPSPCAAATISSVPAAATLAANTTQTFTAGATCSGTPIYKWWVGRVSQGGAIDWVQMSQYTTNNTFAWTPSTPGTYQVAFWVQNQGGADWQIDTVGLASRTVN
jgi:hypothetical protein